MLTGDFQNDLVAAYAAGRQTCGRVGGRPQRLCRRRRRGVMVSRTLVISLKGYRQPKDSTPVDTEWSPHRQQRGRRSLPAKFRTWHCNGTSIVALPALRTVGSGVRIFERILRTRSVLAPGHRTYSTLAVALSGKSPLAQCKSLKRPNAIEALRALVAHSMTLLPELTRRGFYAAFAGIAFPNPSKRGAARASRLRTVP